MRFKRYINIVLLGVILLMTGFVVLANRWIDRLETNQELAEERHQQEVIEPSGGTTE